VDKDALQLLKKLKKALKNIANGNIAPCCCAEEYAQKVLKEV
jgi:hypothetical protein